MSLGNPSRIAAVIGYPVSHSRSPAIHNAAFEVTGLNWFYTYFEVRAGSGAAALDAMRTLNLGGLSVTMPLKPEVAAAADVVDEEVAALGVANCMIPVAGEKLRAANTDSYGFVAGLKADAGITPEGRSVLILGGGGAARAIAWGVASAGAESVTVVNRTSTAAEETAALAGSVGRVGSHKDIRSADIVVNATSVGMGSDKSAPCDPDLLQTGQVAVDIVYEPLETAWLRALRSRDVEAHGGLSMLVHQAARAFTLWTDKPAPVEVMREAALG